MDMRDAPSKHLMTRDALGPGGRVVWDFLSLFAERRHADANALLAPGCRMLFPGGVVMTDCVDVPKNGALNYRWVKKAFHRFDEAQAADGTVVYNFGMLYGEWLDGVPFDNVRYIDRFLIVDGKIADQKVWNDLCIAARARQAR